MPITASLEQRRRSFVMASPDGPATALTNREAAELISRLIALEAMRAGVTDLLQSNSPVPRSNAQLRRLCSDLARLVAQAQPAA